MLLDYSSKELLLSVPKNDKSFISPPLSVDLKTKKSMTSGQPLTPIVNKE
jgi:hypothetical protein